MELSLASSGAEAWVPTANRLDRQPLAAGLDGRSRHGAPLQARIVREGIGETAVLA